MSMSAVLNGVFVSLSVQSQYEQRCSQVIGISLCMKNLSGKYPKFLLMRGTGFAIQGFGSNYIMV